jgi:hypothetical protein
MLPPKKSAEGQQDLGNEEKWGETYAALCNAVSRPPFISDQKFHPL